jgi:hypothetical protein
MLLAHFAAVPCVQVPVASGEVHIGKPTSFPSFGWDNEYGTSVVTVPAFKASQYLATNGEFLPFVMVRDSPAILVALCWLRSAANPDAVLTRFGMLLVVAALVVTGWRLQGEALLGVVGW